MSKDQTPDTLSEWRESAKYWAKHFATIRLMFAPLTRTLIEVAAIVKGQKVLDVAAGPGEPSLTIAEIVGPTGSVTCTDAVADMVEAARAEAAKLGLTNIQFQQCPADSLPFPDNLFDSTVSRLGAMLFPDPDAAFREMLRVTRPGGVLAFAVWHKSELNPFCYSVSDVLTRHFEAAPDNPDAPGAFRFAEPGKLVGLLRKAGTSEVTERVFKFEMAAPVSAKQFWEMRSTTSGTLRAKLTMLPGDVRSLIANEVQQAVKDFFPNNQMKFPAQMLIVSGRRPD